MATLGKTLPICLVMLAHIASLPAGAGQFFLMGDGKIHMRSARNGREARVELLAPDGSLSQEAFTRIDEVFGFPTEERGEHISPRLIFMLDYFSDLVAPGKAINLESGYRDPEYNAALRDSGGNVARTSVHIDGMALDFNIEGVDGKELWEIIKSRDCCGVGHYGGANVHLDASRPRFWEAATSKTRTGESDFNRRIYLSTDYDRYRPGDTMRLAFSSISEFGFGINPCAVFVVDSEAAGTVATVPIQSSGGVECVMIRDRRASRFIYLTVPPDLRAGRYRIRIDFCRRPFEQMPLRTLTNAIEVAGHAR